MTTLNEKIEAFAALLHKEQLEHYLRDYPNSPSAQNASTVSVHHAKKYIRVDVGPSGKFMIERETETIYGIKGYGVIHRGHCYGTLDTISQWYWGEYYPIKGAQVVQ